MKSQRLRWLGHIQRMDENRIPKRILQEKVHNRRRKGRPKKRWLDGVIRDLEIMGVRGWRKKTEDR